MAAPYTIDRTREGYIEIFATADLGAPFSGYVAHGDSGSPPTGCGIVGDLIGNEGELTVPTGGLMGSASIIDGAQGTFLSYRAEALGAFTHTKLFNSPEVFGGPTLKSVNDEVGSNTATAHLMDARGRAQTLTFSLGSGNGLRAVDAVLTADHIYNEFQNSASLGAASEWVVTMPTKTFASFRSTSISIFGLPPFYCIYSGSTREYCRTYFERKVHGRNAEESPAQAATFGFSTNVMPISPSQMSESLVLGSRLTPRILHDRPSSPVWEGAGWIDVNFDSFSTRGSNEGKSLLGLPVIGFWASNIVNANVINGVLGNYASAVRHATSVTCVEGSSATPCD